ncbi:MAG: (deoxy)nucleoside triphosphate pyrophosphohydrolase [Syntrophobacterales bacterium]|nr:(deoxy)nucleoside triphosphate pyrophosphohydrolase [Syntrophobacterales bacterium]
MLIDPILVVAGVIEKDGRFFIAKRFKSEDPLKGTWEFPGGKVKRGETPQESLKRELYEELNIEVEVGDFLVEEIYHYPHISIRLRAYRCTWKGGEIHLKDHGEYAWVLPEELFSFTLSPADYIIAKKLT